MGNKSKRRVVSLYIYKKLEAKYKRLRGFLENSDGHDSDCGVNSEGFEGCDTTMFNCNCGYNEDKRKALEGE